MDNTIYHSSGAELLGLKNNIDIIRNELKKKQFLKTGKSRIQEIILDYIKENKRKIYGGYALNKLLIDKRQDSIYNEYENPDIDFYSPDPNTDIIKICNKLSDAGFIRVNGKEAKHNNTYAIFVNFELYCNITYVPSYIYNNIAFIKIEDINYVNPSFMIIDYLKMITDPIGSYWRIEKSFERLIKLETAFPLPVFKKEIEINSSDNDDNIFDSLQIVINEIKNKDIVTIGFYSYLYYLKESKLYERNKNLLNFSKKSYNQIPYLEIISKNYKTDFDILIKKLKEKYGDSITHTEFYPLFTFFGYSVEIYLNGDLILIIYDYNKKCIPYRISDEIKVSSFSATLLYAQCNVIKFKILKDEDFKLMYMIMVSHLIQMKSYYFSKNKKTIFDNTSFQDFVIDFICPDINPEHELLIKYEKRRLSGKPVMYIYDPVKNRKEEKVEKFFFPNISGNEIVNEKRLRLKDGNIFEDSSDYNSEIDKDEISEEHLEENNNQ